MWVAYTLIRANLIIAPATGKPWWYPYPHNGGYETDALCVLLIAAIIVGTAALVVWVSRHR